jgi:hypothetical protein
MIARDSGSRQVVESTGPTTDSSVCEDTNAVEVPCERENAVLIASARMAATTVAPSVAPACWAHRHMVRVRPPERSRKMIDFSRVQSAAISPA